MLETQLAQIAATIPANDLEKILGQPKILFEIINMVITKDGKSSHGLPYTNIVGEPKSKGVQP